tara:strand:- start:525 stop:1031 length:507 start_codon:yes stop_codon:yes gene_type:complete
MKRLRLYFTEPQGSNLLAGLWGTLVLSTLLVFAAGTTGCQTSTYDQEAGPTAKWPERAQTGDAASEPHGARVRYEFDPVTGKLLAIEFDVTNATEFAMLDMSGISSKSAISKSSLSAAGSRDGMNGNVTEVRGEAKTEAKLDAVIKSLAGLAKEVAKMKSPVPLPDKE